MVQPKGFEVPRRNTKFKGLRRPYTDYAKHGILAVTCFYVTMDYGKATLTIIYITMFLVRSFMSF
jgi:hypothetical protein